MFSALAQLSERDSSFVLPSNFEMPTFLVVGATGQQGGAVVQVLLGSERNDLIIRAVSRNPLSASATGLRNRGVEVVKGDLADAISLEAALRGCDAAYLVTDFRGPNDITGEIEQGHVFTDAAKRAGEGSHLLEWE